MPLEKTSQSKVSNHPFFGSLMTNNDSVDDVMKRLRLGRSQ